MKLSILEFTVSIGAAFGENVNIEGARLIMAID
jgi:hypothetical protein